MNILLAWAIPVFFWNMVWAVIDYIEGENYWNRWRFIPILIFNITGLIALLIFLIIGILTDY